MAEAAAAEPSGLGGAFTSSWRWFGKYFGKFLGFAFIVAGFVALVLFVLFLWNLKQYGGLDALSVRTFALMDQVGAAPLANALRTYAARGFSGELLFGESAVESDIAASQGSEVRVKDVQVVNKPLFYGKDIFLVGTLSVKNPPKDMVIGAACAMDENIADAVLSGPGGVASVLKGQTQIFSISCTLPKVNAPAKSNVVSPNIENRQLTAEVLPPTQKKVDVLGRFSYESVASLGTYVYNAQDMIAFTRSQQSATIFAEKGIKDPQVSSDGTVRSITSQGPVNLGLKTVSQPLVEESLNVLQVSLSSNLAWASQNNGKMKKLESFELSAPDFLVFAGESGFPKSLTQATCDFIFTGQKNERGEKIYTLSEARIAEANKECTKENLKTSTLTVSECEDLFNVDGPKNYFCSFMLTKPFADLKKAFIEARAEYIYEVRGSTAVTIRPEPVGIV